MLSVYSDDSIIDGSIFNDHSSNTSMIYKCVIQIDVLITAIHNNGRVADLHTCQTVALVLLSHVVCIGNMYVQCMYLDLTLSVITYKLMLHVLSIL